ncbi:TIGR00341 family protein [Thermomonas sp.]|uniref:TIGR00341 family protein n=1 Tax=Thermomonas sp. TaxID=1971895 RepID=UPI0024888D8D|nr:TIGR00341 family protein [Thermomonas sp.]MDI1252249.1 TIGR00341 family protein [Thermomonas sp.]
MAVTSFDLPNPRALWRWLRQWRQNQLVDNTDRISVLEHVDEAGHLGPRYAFMTMMSCGIAMLGLLQNSAAVIIGAMLISPLMGPIIELGLGLATFDLRSIRDALKTLFVGVLLSLLVAAVIVHFSPLQDATPEILARTEPTFFDLLIAIFSGLAGAYATVTRKGEMIVGVAIATALMPPLAVAGYGIAVLNWNIAGGAAFLFMTNLLAIGLSVTIVARWYGFGGTDSPKQTAWQAGLIIGSFVLLSIPLGLALKRIALKSQVELGVRVATDAAAQRASGRVSALRVDMTSNGVNVDTVMMVPHHINGLEASLQEALTTQLGRPVNVQVREVLTADDASFALQQGTLAELRRSVAALQTAESGRTATQQANDAQLVRLQAELLGYLGRLTPSADGRHWTLQVTPGSRMPLQLAQRIEREVNTGLASDGGGITVLPPLQPLPGIMFADDSAELDTDSASTLATLGWAVQRWHGDAVHVIGVGGTEALAQKRADAVAGALRASGLQASVSLDDAAVVRARVREDGPLAARTVRLEIGEAR